MRVLKDSAVLLLAIMGILSDINWMDIPFWAFILVFMLYAMFRIISIAFPERDFKYLVGKRKKAE
jgi:hypothetical protein